MLLAKVADKPFATEVPMEIWDKIAPAAPLADVASAKLAMICTGGVVPWGNPDGFKTYRNTFWRKYSFAELKTLEPGKWEAVHGGYNVAFMNQNPHYGVPLTPCERWKPTAWLGVACFTLPITLSPVIRAHPP